ncbi:MAG: hypothetical protein ACFFDN_39020 [Candidatus Hodarchaeota archaeon]
METKIFVGCKKSEHKEQMVTDTIPTIIEILKAEKSDLKKDAAFLKRERKVNPT